MNDRRDTFTLKDVVFNLLFIILFVFILLWLFPSKSFMIENFGNNGKNNAEAKTNHVFNSNITTMKEAAISYFTTPRLPKKVGEAVKLTLRDMRDKKLVLDLIDSKGKLCDEHLSYVEMIKENDEYLLKVYLACSDYEDYILVHLGCYDYCEGDGICEKEKEELLHQYKKEIPCKMTDWSAWTAWTTEYLTPNNNRKVETKVEKETINATLQKNCPSGFVYNKDADRCYKSSTSTDTKDADTVTTYSCETGYELNEITNKCEKKITLTDIVDALKEESTYNCDKYGKDYKVEDILNETTNKIEKMCVKRTTSQDVKDGTPVYVRTCSKGSLSADKTKCTYQIYTTYTVNATKSCSTKKVEVCNNAGRCWYEDKTSCTYKCSQGVKDGTKCIISGWIDKSDPSIEVIGSYSCPSGYNQNGSKCYKNIENIDKQKVTEVLGQLYCKDSKYTLDGTKCKYSYSKVETKDSVESKNYTCVKHGKEYYLDGTKCIKVNNATESTNPTTGHICPVGYDKNNTTCFRNIIKYRYSTKTCEGGSVDYKWSYSNNDKTLIEQGYIYTGEIKKNEIK